MQQKERNLIATQLGLPDFSSDGPKLFLLMLSKISTRRMGVLRALNKLRILRRIYSKPGVRGYQRRVDLDLFPGRPQGNWTWRYQASQLNPLLMERLADMTELYGRGRLQ